MKIQINFCVKKIKSEKYKSVFAKKLDLKNTNQFLVFIKEFLLAIVDFET